MCLKLESKSFLWACLFPISLPVTIYVCFHFTHHPPSYGLLMPQSTVFFLKLNRKCVPHQSPQVPRKKQESSLLQSSKIPPTLLSWGMRAGTWTWQGCIADKAHSEPSLMLQREVFWLVRASHERYVVYRRSHQAGTALTSGQLQLREQKGVAQEQTGDALGREENIEGGCPFCCDLPLKRNPLKRIL